MEYVARKARSLVQEKRDIGFTQQKKGKILSQDTINLVKPFYDDDEFS